MVELAEERQVLQDLLPELSDELVNLSAWVFESDAPASNMTIREVYLNALKNSGLYIGLFWNDYGEYTIDEFNRATEWAIDRHIYVKNVNPEARDPQLTAFLDAQSGVISGITPKWFTTIDDLREQVSKSIQVWLKDRLQRRPGDSSAIYAEFSDDIPELPKKLIGRDNLVSETLELLEEGSRVLLQGFGGMGKTAIAATIAADWIDDDNGAVLWLRAGSEDVDAMLEALVKPFEEQQAVTSAEGKAKLRAVRNILSDTETSLVVLDDVWDGTALNQIMKAFPRHMPVLVTARQRYAMDDILEVGKLTPKKAVELLGHHAREKFTDNSDAAELCRQVGYHAFALEVAGKTIKVDRITPKVLLERITDAPHDMVMPGDFAEEGRTSIKELLDASIYALDEETRRVFLAFGGLFVQDVTAELLGRYMGKDEIDMIEALTTLQRRGLAERMQTPEGKFPYYHVHNLAYSYIKTVTDKGRDKRPKAIQACLDYVKQHASDLDALDAEQGNFMSAAEAAQELGDVESLIEMMSVLIGLYLASRGHSIRFLSLLDAAIEAAENLGADYDEARHHLLSKRGNAYFERSDKENARRCYLEAFELARKLDLKDRAVILLSVIGVRSGKNQAESETYLKEAASLADEIDNDFLRAFVLGQRGFYAQSQGDHTAAKDYYAQQAALGAQMENNELQYYSLVNLGSAENNLGETETALEHHHGAFNIARDTKNHIWMAHALQAIGEDYQKLGQYEMARRYFDEALQLFQDSGIRTQVVEINDLLATLKDDSE